MTETTLNLFTVCAALALVQLLAALPWLAALNRSALLFYLRHPVSWGYALLCILGAAAGVTFLLGSATPDAGTLANWGRLYGSFLQLQLTADFVVVVFAALLKFWPKGAAVALSAFRESLRQPMFWLLYAVAVLLFGIVPLLPYFTFGEDLKMVKELAYDIIMLFAVVFAIIAASSSVSEEIEGRTAVTLMSKPISRRQFLLGKFIGIYMSTLVMVGLLGWKMVWMFLFKQYLDPPRDPRDIVADPAWVVQFVQQYLPAGDPAHLARGVGLWLDDAASTFPGLVIVSCQVMILLAIATALATRLPMVVNIPVCVIFYFLGHLTPILVAVSKLQLVKFMAQVFDTLLPGLEHFSLGAVIVRDAPLPPGEFALYTANVALYAVLYTAIALLFGLILFEDRDLA
jgi:ABC-type transport system involved in multi-copper enzyme maturation permease subunit